MENNNLNIKKIIFLNLIITFFVSLLSYNLWTNISLFEVFIMNNVWLIFILIWLITNLIVDILNIKESFLFIIIIIWAIINYYNLYLIYKLIFKHNKYIFYIINIIFIFLNIAIWLAVHY